jgi:integrase
MIVPRSGRFGVRVYEEGKYRWIGTYESEADAHEAEAAAKLRPAKQVPTVKQWADVWLSDYARPAPATQRTYRYAVKQIVARIGSRRMDDIDRPEARKIAGEVPRNTVYVARTMWADAVGDGVCEHNPWTGMRLRGSPGRKDIDALTPEEIASLARSAEEVHGEYGREAAAIIVTLAYTTMRPAELCALRWSDVDFERDEIRVVLSLDALGNEKSRKKGVACVIALAPQVRTALAGVPRRTDSPHVFHSIRGRRLNKSNIQYQWGKVRAHWMGAGGRETTLYELRHAGATLLIEAGLDPSQVALQLGHRDGGRLVTRLYGHPNEDRVRDRIRMAYGSMTDPLETQERRKGAAA